MNVAPSRSGASSRAAERRGSAAESLAGDAPIRGSAARFDWAIETVGSGPELEVARHPEAWSAPAGAASGLAPIEPLTHGFWTSSDKTFEFGGLDNLFRLMRVLCQRRNLFGNSGMSEEAALFCDRSVAIE
jgi:hypothetical protein